MCVLGCCSEAPQLYPAGTGSPRGRAKGCLQLLDEGARHNGTETGGRGLVKGHPERTWQLIRVLALSDFLRLSGLLSCIQLQGVLC